MSDFQLSSEQRAAVENRGGTLLVSAAAGSGKTRVLVERLFRYLTEEHRDVDEFLIITFTRAAAAELRGRIAEELNARLAVTPDDAHLQRQLLRIYRADIKTIDAFCSALVRENVHLLEEDRRGGRLTADFRTLDENEAGVLRRRVLQRVLEAYYDRAETGGDTSLADTFGCGRDDSALGELVLELHDRIQSHAYPLRWLEEMRRQWENLPDDPGEMAYGQELLERLARKAAYWSARLEGEAERFSGVEALQRAYGGQFRDVSGQLSALRGLAEAERWDEVCAFTLAFPRLSPVRGEEAAGAKETAKAVWERCKKELGTELRTFAVRPGDYLADLRAAAPAVCGLLSLTEEFSLCYREEKTRRNTADFSDQEHDAIRLLLRADGAPTELGETVAGRYREIMVDEYQDTNEVQNCIFSAVSREGRNLFAVGDVKQSIYRFRLADPGIFLRKYKEFSPWEEAEEGAPRKLLLTRNYRSRPEVLEAVNFIFSNILSRELGEMEYGEEERLRAGSGAFSTRDDCGTEFHLIDLPRRQEAAQKLKRTDAEARFVADRIRRLLDGQFPVQGEDGAPRPVRPEDIAVLMRSPASRLSAYRQALEDRAIPCSAESGGEFFETLEIAVTFQLLQIIDNPRQDVPLISVLSSPLAGFTPDHLARIRAESPKTDFYTALAASEDADAQAFLARLRALRAAAKDLSVTRLLGRLYDEWNLPGIFGAMEGGRERRANLAALLEHARRFESAGYRGLFAFTAELRAMLERGETPAAALKAPEGGVRIMSIHKSKGLEFPVVFLTDLAHGFNRQDFTAPVLVHPTLGLGPMFIDLRRRIKYPTLARKAVESRLSREMKAEEMRILYVAMTRAREKLILVHSEIGAEKRLASLAPLAACPADPEALNACGCLGEWILLPLLCRPEAAPLRALAGAAAPETIPAADAPWSVFFHDGMLYRRRGPQRETGEEPEPEARREIPFSRSLLEFRYPYARDVTLPTVVSATQLEGGGTADGSIRPHLRGLARPAFLAGAAPLTPVEAGTATHALMEFLDFSCPGTTEAVEAEIVRLTAAGRLTKAQAAVIRREEVAALLASPLGAALRQAETLHREYRLSLLVDARLYDPEASAGTQILLHGVVDCWYERADGTLEVVDFKTDRVRGAALTARAEEYRPQVEAYAAALSRILEKRVGGKSLYFFSEGRTINL